jgi:hypothetical protein
MKAIVRKRQNRKLAERNKANLVFHVRGAKVNANKIERWMSEHNVPDDMIYEPFPSARK